MHASPELFKVTYDCLHEGDLLLIGTEDREEWRATDSAQPMLVGLKAIRNARAFFGGGSLERYPLEYNPLLDGFDTDDTRAISRVKIARNIVPIPPTEDVRQGDAFMLPVVGFIMDRSIGLFVTQPSTDPVMYLMKPFSTSII